MRPPVRMMIMAASVATLSATGLALGVTSAQADVSVGDPGSTWYVVWKASDPFFINFPNIDHPLGEPGTGSSVCLAPTPCRHEEPLPGTTPIGGKPINKGTPPSSK